MNDKTHAQSFAAGQHGAVSDHTPAGKAAAWAGHSHRVAAERQREADEAARKRAIKIAITVPRPISPLSPRDMKEIDAWVEWWFDTDTLFGIANAICFTIGGLGGLIWAIVSAFQNGLTFGSIVLMPIAALFIGAIAGAFAPAGVFLWGLWEICGWVVGLF